MKSIGAVILGVALSSFVEYMLHRFYLHQPRHTHLTIHHMEYKQKTFTRDVAFTDVASSIPYILSNMLLYGVVFIIIGWIDLQFSIVGFVTGVGYTVWIEWIHYEFHSSNERFYKKHSWFKTLKKHHYEHHSVFKENFNIGSRWWDIILKTNTF